MLWFKQILLVAVQRNFRRSFSRRSIFQCGYEPKEPASGSDRKILMAQLLNIFAGGRARRHLASYGYRRDDFTTLLGASGGPKWLVLAAIDRVLCERLVQDRTRELHLLGSSIGAWRHICFAQRDPLGACARFQQAYTSQVYEEKPTGIEVLREMEDILAVTLGDGGEEAILQNQQVRSHVLAVRSRAAVSANRHLPLLVGLGAAAAANTVSRPALAAFFERWVFHTGEPVFGFEGFGTRQVALRPGSLRDTVLATGAVPLLIPGIRDLPGAAPGVYRDGGIVDYHFDFSFRRPQGLVLFPHFFSRISPGWFDKFLPWRSPAPGDLEDVVQVAPSEAFIAGLPGGRVPDRSDFENFSTADRQSAWAEVLRHAEDLGEELEELLSGDGLSARLKPFPGT